MEKVYRSHIPPFAVPEGISVHQFLTRYDPDAVPPDKVILEELEAPHKKITYGGLRTQAAMGAAALEKEYGFGPGDTALIYSANSVDYSLFAHSVMWAGGTIAGVNTAWMGAELGHAITTTAPKIIACEAALKARVEKGLQEATGIERNPHILELGDKVGAFPRSFIDDPPGGLVPLPPFDLTGKDSRKYAGLILFSSGTTGNPKAVLLSHHNLIAHLQGMRTSDPMKHATTAREVFFAPFPHMIGAFGAVLQPAFVGSYIGLLRKFSLEEYIQACARIKATALLLVPSVAVAFAQHPLIQELDLTSVNTITSAGATLKEEVVQKLQKLLRGVSIVQGYGMSEAGISTLPVNRSVEKAGSVGRLMAGVEIRIVDEELRDVEIGQPGEVLAKGPSVFMGYKNNEEATRASFHNGWLRTGDVVSIENDGFLWFHERRKELIKVKGNQVAPSELEGILGSHSEIIEAAVCSYFDDERQTEWPIGYVVLSPSVPVGERQRVLDEIRVWVDGQVATYKQLRGGLHHIDALPKNPTGKLMRNKLPIKLAQKRGVKM